MSINDLTQQTHFDIEKIQWDNSLTLPNINGKANIGVAGAFFGFIGEHLIVAGGTNFPETTPWEGGHKIWWNTIYYINATEANATWTIEKMSKALAYGNSIELSNGLLCIGGCDSTQCYNDVFLIQLIDGHIKIDTDWPNLPVPLANATASLVENRIYIAGGQKYMQSQEATKYFFMLDLNEQNKGWVELPSWPGEPRGYAVSCAQYDGSDNCFYLFSGRNYKSDGYVKVLTDGYIYNHRLNYWKKLEFEFPVMAGTAIPFDNDQILLLGGVPLLISGSEDHPGFDNTVRVYHTIKKSLIEKETAPFPIAVTTSIAKKGNVFYLGSGEIKPGIRTPHLLKGNIISIKKES